MISNQQIAMCTPPKRSPLPDFKIACVKRQTADILKVTDLWQDVA